MKIKIFISVIIIISIYIIKPFNTLNAEYIPSIINKLNNSKNAKEQENIFIQYGIQNYYKSFKESPDLSKDLNEILSSIEIQEYANYAYTSKNEAKKILEKIGVEEDLDIEDKKEKILKYMIKVKYEPDDNKNDILKAIFSVFETNKGDCEDQSVLAASLLNEIGFTTYLFHRKGYIDINGKRIDGHIYVATEGTISNHTHSFERNGKIFYLKAYELTGDNVDMIENINGVKGYKIKAYKTIYNDI